LSYIVALGIALLLALGWYKPDLGEGWFAPIENRFARFATNKLATVFAIGLTAILLRLALLPLPPVPVPIIHDEFSNLLAADTFAHGRLTNPPHPMWIFFDTFHVLQHPTYASKYPPATGLVLAFGKLLGHPWLGTLLTLGLMCMAMTWMLQGWFPPHWALLGGVLVLLRLCLPNYSFDEGLGPCPLNYWFDGYLGAAIPTTGAALVLGAVPRLIRSPRTLHASGMGFGVLILVLSRPLEGLLFCLPVAIALPFAFSHQNPSRRDRIAALWTALIPVATILGAGLLWLGYYNWRVTGSAFLFPYFLYHREYVDYPVFVWQRVRPVLHYANPQFDAFFNQWQRAAFQLTPGAWAGRALASIEEWWGVYIGPILTVPLIALPCLLRDRRVRLPLTQILVCGIGLLAVVWFQPHYAAPMAASLFIVLLQAIRHLRHFHCMGRSVGIYATRVVILLALGWVPFMALRAAQHPIRPWSQQRQQIAERLRTLPGRHLVLVQYSPTHNVHQEWVFNDADIDHSQIIWARAIPGQDVHPLLDYYPDRTVWTLYPDQSPPRVDPYPGPR
jgi:hypothetical protein